MSTDAEDVTTRWRDSMARAAARAYEAAHGNPLPTEAKGVRFRLEPRAAAAIAIALTALGLGAYLMLRSPAAPLPVLSVGTAEGALGMVTVHVTGAVTTPGVVTLEGGARVTDAIEAAGGFTANADEASLNLARVVRDGEQVLVPVVGAEGDGRVNLNRATASELDLLPGIGPVLAERIVADREAHGAFLTLEDLGRVPGIGDAVITDISPLVTM